MAKGVCRGQSKAHGMEQQKAANDSIRTKGISQSGQRTTLQSHDGVR